MEKKLLTKLSNEDIEEINKGEITTAEKIIHNKYEARFLEAIIAGSAVVTAGVTGGLALDRAKQHLKEQRIEKNKGKDTGWYEYEQPDYLWTFFSTLLSGVVAGVIIHSQPKAEHVGAAVNNLIIEWLTPIKQSGGRISKESIEERIKILTQFQKTNSASVSGKQ